MSLQGPLETVDLPHLIELAQGMDQPTAVVLETPQGVWRLFVVDGQVVHAEGPNGQTGEAAVPAALQARAGTFRLVPGQAPPTTTITRPWNAVLLDALRQLDEASEASSAAAAPFPPQEDTPMTRPKKTRERIAELLANLLDESADIIGAAVVGTDGLIYSANFPRRDADQNLIAASSAAVYGLSQRTMQQLHEGQFVQTLIEGSDGYLLVRSVTPRVLFVGVLPREVNLGMAFAEARTVTAKLAEILQGLA